MLRLLRKSSARPETWNRFHRFVNFGPTETSRCYRRMQLGAIDLTTGKTTCHLLLWFFWSSSTQWILSSTSITLFLLLWLVTQGPNPCDNKSIRSFLEIDVKGGERDHIKSFIYRERDHIYFIISLGGENTQGKSNLQWSQMLGVQEERCYMSSRGERHVHMC